MKLKFIILFSLFFFIFYFSPVFAQVVYEPIYNDVYSFLSLTSQKGLIEYNDLIKPLSRKYIAQKLMELENQVNKLTPLEKEELQFYVKDFGKEIALQNKKQKSAHFGETQNENIKFLNKDKYGRWRLFSYEDSLFFLNVSPILGYEIGKKEGQKITHLWNGLYFYGYLTNKIGFSFSFRDNDETGKTLDRKREFTPETGMTISLSRDDGFQYDQIRTSIGTDWSWGSFSIGKEFLEWGYAQSGKIVLSDKAPSYPYLRLDIHPVKWLYFNYIHAWLSSGVIDSSASYATLLKGRNRIQYRSKFLASHTLTIIPTHNLSISLGESVIYSDKLEPVYLFPLMFFRSADHYLSKNNNNAGSNSQFFFNISSRNQIPNTHLYGTLFIDELALSNIFNPKRQRNQIAFTLGGSVTDLLIDNLTTTVEYTKLYPFVYRHYIPTLTYENQNYLLGDWIGHNADMIYTSFNYRFIRGLQATLWGEYIRKGGNGVVNDQYKCPYPPFLFGLRKNYIYWGFDAKYEIMHDFFARLKFQSYYSSKEQADGLFINKKFNEFSIALYYGM